MARGSRGFTLLETLIALSLVSVSMTGLVVAIGSSSKFGALARRQATAMMVARTVAEDLSHRPYGDVSLTNAITANDVDDSFADPAGGFATGTVATSGAKAPDYSFPAPILIGADAANSIPGEKYDVFVNVRPSAETGACAGAPVEQGKQFAVIVRYKIGSQWMRAVALGYRYNPCVLGVTDGLPL